ncbi:MAG: thioredoxin family protein [Halapricum sp.]
MDNTALLDDLITNGVVTEDADGNLIVNAEFKEYRSEHVEQIDRKEASEIERLAAEHGFSADVSAGVLASALAIRDFGLDLDDEDVGRAATALNRFTDSTPTDGVPDGFIPIAGDEIDDFIDAHSGSVLYFWRENCDPCDFVRDHLETLSEDGKLADYGTGAVYGPEHSRLIYEEYDVYTAPTVLFCEQGSVHSRLIGSHGFGAYESELEVLEEYL